MLPREELSVPFSSGQRLKPAARDDPNYGGYLSVPFSSGQRLKLLPELVQTMEVIAFSPLFVGAKVETLECFVDRDHPVALSVPFSSGQRLKPFRTNDSKSGLLLSVPFSSGQRLKLLEILLIMYEA